MKINKDLIDATLMLSLISLVLVATTDFSNTITKDLTMGALGLLSVGMALLRILSARREAAAQRNSEEMPLDYKYE